MITVTVDGVRYETVCDVDGTPLPGAPRLAEPWWYQLVPHGHCPEPPMPADTYWHLRRFRAQRLRRMRRSIHRIVLEQTS